MTATYNIKVQELNPQFMRDLQKRYPGAKLEVKVRKDHHANHLDEDGFWSIIALLDWEKEGDDEAVVEPVVAKLASMPVHFIYGFQDILSEKLHTLDSKDYAAQIGEDSWREGQFFSVDNFLYARCCVVANGREAYERVRKDPAAMPKDLSFEPLLSVASKAYRRKTGEPLEYLPTFNYETFSNKKGWD
jgi:hypothetical protein